MNREASVGPFVVELGKHAVDSDARQAHAQVVACRPLDHVGLVEDHHVVVGQQTRTAPAQRQV